MKTVLITGATDGIGRQTAIDLAKLGMKVIVHGRSQKRIDETINEIKESTKNANVESVLADFEYLEQVVEMAESIKKTNTSIDILYNNAAIILPEKSITSNGIEEIFQVNHLAGFLLTELLIDLLENSQAARIINVSSMIHAAEINFENLQGELTFQPSKNYALSKLCNIIHAYSLSRKYSPEKISSNAMHPGVIETKLLNAAFAGGAPVSEGARTMVYLATEDIAQQLTGQYFENNRPMQSNPLSYDTEIQDKLWDYSMNLVKPFLKK